MNRIQDWFTKMVRGLAGQDWTQSLSESGFSCRYRGAEGKKCALGHIISDELAATPFCEGNTFPFLIKHSKPGQDLAGASIREIDFLDRAQTCHDYNRYGMKQAFRDLAVEFNLEWPEDVK